ncbi:dentin sialophosphoprotein isoform X2 [Parasteatoda tepidariorum]|uniref:dentin sialophosphoprotein isoform X2 n=1 Tax=Parasteatoda tepidariorum TaxID=114398 RepID=UPI0039BCB104
MISFIPKCKERVRVFIKSSNDLKRKSSDVETEQQPSKKLRVTVTDEVSPIQSEIVSSSSSSNDVSPVPSSQFEPSSLQSSSSSSSSSSSEGGQDDEMSVDDEDYLPRRRGPQMWNSRQRWKDERKKVLKMSINKLADIEDPELCLLRSVLINNTIKKLHLDIRNERQAKLRQRQQRIDFFSERYSPFASTQNEDNNAISDCFTIDFSNGSNTNTYNSNAKQNSAPSNSNSADFHDDSSCDEMFGINDDFLRVPIPDRRVSSPIPTSSENRRTEPRDSSSASDSTNSCCDTNRGSFQSTQNNSQTVGTATTPPSYPQATTVTSPPHSNRRAPLSSSGSQCAMQYRTNRDLGVGEVSFPPRVPILDSVVYHSLLASLESS